jgi:hypothetical protein
MLCSAGGGDRWLVESFKPAVAIFRFSAEQPEERVLKLLGYRTAMAFADFYLVDGSYGGDFDGCTRKKHFVGKIEHLARNRLLHDIDTKLAGKLDDGVARNAG